MRGWGLRDFSEREMGGRSNSHDRFLPARLSIMNSRAPPAMLPAQLSIMNPRAPPAMIPVFAGRPRPVMRRGGDTVNRTAVQGMAGYPRTPDSSESNMPEDFQVIQDLGSADGCFNSGILIVKYRRTGQILVEKKMNSSMVQNGFAKDEIDILKQIHDQPFIIDMAAAFVHPSMPLASIVTEYCDLGSLGDLIKRHDFAREPIAEGWIWKVFHQVSCGLFVLYSKRILHLDLKPGNILLKSGDGRTPNVKIADFGSACGGESDAEGSQLRDRAFVSPDRARNKAADVWSLGATMICLCQLTQDPPRDRHGYVDRSIGPQYSKDLFQGIIACMRTSSGDRLSSKDLPEYVVMMNSKGIGTRREGALPIPPSGRIS